MTSKTNHIAQDFIIIHVMAKPGKHFASYDLLQAISATGMQFGAMNIFHYYSAESDKKSLFSLASATEPGEFDLDRMGNFSCAGLTLFMNLLQVQNKEEVFLLMLRTAEQLAEDLQGEIRAENRVLWNEEAQQQYQERVR
ncbi:MAG: zipA [Gammaproteobacteria bacterium]|jgi:cell division protein ZipA|nr:zipA [Gammaproteobacteria bacterium]